METTNMKNACVDCCNIIGYCCYNGNYMLLWVLLWSSISFSNYLP